MRLFFTLLTLIPLTVFSQVNDSTPSRKFSFGITFSPDYCYRTLKSDTSVKWLTDSRDSLEIPKFGFTAGLNLALKINNRISLETGLLFSDKGEKTKEFALFGITPSGQPDPDQPTKCSSVFHYSYIDIPVKVHYYLLTQRAKLFLSAGISPNVFLSQSVTSTFEYSDGHTTKTTSAGNAGFTGINLTVIAGLGFGYDLTNKFYLKIEPEYRRSITSIVDAPMKVYLYSIGINTGLYYKL